MARNVPNIYSYKNNYMQDHSDSIEILILGASHTFEGLKADSFSTRTFNMANPSQELEYDEFLLYKYVNICRKGCKTDKLKRVLACLLSNDEASVSE